jgi:hypothetical protein
MSYETRIHRGSGKVGEVLDSLYRLDNEIKKAKSNIKYLKNAGFSFETKSQTVGNVTTTYYIDDTVNICHEELDNLEKQRVLKIAALKSK